MVNIHMLGVAVCAFRDFRILPVQRKITEKELRTPRLFLKTAVTKKNIPLQEHSGHKEQTTIEKGDLFPRPVLSFRCCCPFFWTAYVIKCR